MRTEWEITKTKKFLSQSSSLSTQSCSWPKQLLRCLLQLRAKIRMGDDDQFLGAAALGLAEQASDPVLSDHIIGELARRSDKAPFLHQRDDARDLAIRGRRREDDDRP